MKTILTIGITTYYNTNLVKFKFLLDSLINENSNDLWEINKDNFKKPIDENIKLLNKLSSIDDNKVVTNIPKNMVELLVIIDNDGKHDIQVKNIAKLLEEFKKKSNGICRVKYIVTNVNVKVSCARNIIMNEASGEYLVFTDDDDIRSNIKSLLNLIKFNKNYDYLGYYIINSTYEELNLYKKGELIENELTNKPFISNISCYSAILKRKYYIDNKLYFTPNLSTEDVVWRSNLNYILNYHGGDIKQTQFCCYVHMEPSNASLNNSVNNTHINDVRFLDDITVNNLSVLEKNNDYYYSLINMIMSQFLEIGFKLTDYRIFAITSSSTYYRGYNLIKYWMNMNLELFKSSTYDYEMIKLSRELTSDVNLFNELESEDKELLIEYIPKYFSIPDLMSISGEIDNFITLDIADDLLQYKFNYKLYEKKICESKYLSEFIFRFVCLIHMRDNKKYKHLVENKINVLNKIMDLYNSEAKETPIIEFYDYTHDYLLRRFGISNMYNYYNNKEITFDNIQDKIKNSHLLDSCYKLYTKDKDLKTTTLGKFDRHFKGIMNVLVFYILSCNQPINPINHIDIIKTKDYTRVNDDIKSYNNIIEL